MPLEANLGRPVDTRTGRRHLYNKSAMPPAPKRKPLVLDATSSQDHLGKLEKTYRALDRLRLIYSMLNGTDYWQDLSDADPAPRSFSKFTSTLPAAPTSIRVNSGGFSGAVVPVEDSYWGLQENPGIESLWPIREALRTWIQKRGHLISYAFDSISLGNVGYQNMITRVKAIEAETHGRTFSTELKSILSDFETKVRDSADEVGKASSTMEYLDKLLVEGEKKIADTLGFVSGDVQGFTDVHIMAVLEVFKEKTALSAGQLERLEGAWKTLAITVANTIEWIERGKTETGSALLAELDFDTGLRQWASLVKLADQLKGNINDMEEAPSVLRELEEEVNQKAFDLGFEYGIEEGENRVIACQLG